MDGSNERRGQVCPLVSGLHGVFGEMAGDHQATTTTAHTINLKTDRKTCDSAHGNATPIR